MKDYIKGIDGLRGIAVLSVIIYHMNSTYLPGGFAGVDIFFVISGYVISKSLYKSKEDGIKTYIFGFYKRRIARILPPLAVTLFVTMLISTLFIAPFGLSANNGITGIGAFAGIGNIILSKNLYSYFAPYIEFNPFAHTWSLGIEEQFYVLFPLIFYLIIQKGRKKWFGVSLFVITILVSLYFNITYILDEKYLKSYYLLESRFWELASGSLLFLLHNKGITVKNRIFSYILSFIALLTFVYSLIFSSHDKVMWAVIPITASLLLISQVSNKSKNIINYIFESKILVAIGKISYSLYLWHWPIAVLLRWTIGFESVTCKIIYIVLSFLMAIISYYFIEKKAKKTKRIIVLVLMWVILFFSSWFIDSKKETLTLSITKDIYTWLPWYNYAESESLKDQYPELQGKKLFVVGDSHASAYKVMISEVSHILGIKNVIYEMGDRPVGNLLYTISEVGDDDYYVELFKKVKSEIKEGDILFLACLRMPELANAFKLVDIDGIVEEFFSEESKNNRKLALEELSLIIKDFDSMGVKVLIDAPKPGLKAQPYRCSDWFNKNNPLAKPGKEIDMELNLKIRAPLIESLDELQSRHSNLYVWDPLYILKENDGINDKPLYFDDNHLSAHGNRVLLPSFKEKLVEIWE